MLIFGGKNLRECQFGEHRRRVLFDLSAYVADAMAGTLSGHECTPNINSWDVRPLVQYCLHNCTFKEFLALVERLSVAIGQTPARVDPTPSWDSKFNFDARWQVPLSRFPEALEFASAAPFYPPHYFDLSDKPIILGPESPVEILLRGFSAAGCLVDPSTPVVEAVQPKLHRDCREAIEAAIDNATQLLEATPGGAKQ
jgi:hypothetical protein